MAQPEPIHIEGTTLEGGGQLVRISLCLSALTGRAIRITSIRGNRSRGGGLKGQHLTAARWLANACTGGASVEGLELGSRTLVFAPGVSSPQPVARDQPWWHPTMINIPSGEQVAARATTLDLKTPGAVTLVLQALLPFLLFSPSPDSSAPEPILLTVKGGTNVSMSPSIDYIHHVLFPNLRLIFPNISSLEVLRDVKRLRRGWSTGKIVIGEASFLISPLAVGSRLVSNKDLLNAPLLGAQVTSLKAFVLAPSTTSLPAMVGKILLHALRENFRTVDKSSIDIQIEDSRHPKRLYLLLVAETSSGIRVGNDWLYDMSLKDERSALEKAANSLVERVVEDLLDDLSSKTCPLDRHMMDQIVVFQALAGTRTFATGSSTGDATESDKRKVEQNLHSLTAQWICSLMLEGQSSTDGVISGVAGNKV